MVDAVLVDTGEVLIIATIAHSSCFIKHEHRACSWLSEDMRIFEQLKMNRAISMQGIAMTT